MTDAGRHHGEGVASPCTNVCAIDPVTGWCRGCLRTLDEIAAWPAASDDDKHAVLARLERRRELLNGAHARKGAAGDPPRIVPVGEVLARTLELTDASIREFATLAEDFNPLHHDVGYAARSRFGQLIASGTQPSAVFMALLATHFSRRAQPLGLDFSMTLKQGARSGDTLTMTWRVSSSRWKASLGGDLVTLDGEVVNQHGKIVILGRATIVVMPKPDDAGAPR
jgi:acyl dehydratase